MVLSVWGFSLFELVVSILYNLDWHRNNIFIWLRFKFIDALQIKLILHFETNTSKVVNSSIAIYKYNTYYYHKVSNFSLFWVNVKAKQNKTTFLSLAVGRSRRCTIFKFAGQISGHIITANSWRKAYNWIQECDSI